MSIAEVAPAPIAAGIDYDNPGCQTLEDVKAKLLQHEILRDCLEGAEWAFPFVTELANHTPYKFQHSMNVALLSYLFAKELYGYSHDNALILARAGVVHDIGYAQVRRELANKRFPLTEDEYKEQQSHVLDSVNKINKFDPALAAIVLGHHQFIHGAYPPIHEYPPLNEEVKRMQEVLALADQVEALMSPRPYKPGFSESETIFYLTHDRDGNVTNFFDRTRVENATRLGRQFFKNVA